MTTTAKKTTTRTTTVKTTTKRRPGQKQPLQRLPKKFFLKDNGGRGSQNCLKMLIEKELCSRVASYWLFKLFKIIIVFFLNLYFASKF